MSDVVAEKANNPTTRVNSVVFPGETYTAKELTGKTGKTRIGIGLTPSPNNQKSKAEAILVTRAGVLKSRNSDPPKLWVTNRQRRYIPYSADRVVGIITKRTALYYEVNINGPADGLLGVLEFEGATKRNKPDLNVGDIVFCNVTISNPDMQPILSCKSPAFNKSWVSGEALFTQLKNGFIVEVSLNWSQKLNRMKSPQLEYVATFFPFEVAIGVNGRIWVNTGTIKTTLLLCNIIKNGEYCTLRQFKIMVQTLLQQHGMRSAQ